MKTTLTTIGAVIGAMLGVALMHLAPSVALLNMVNR